MKLLLLTAGSRGDVEPFSALAGHAAAAGHEVHLAVPDNSGVDLPAVPTVPLDIDFARLTAGQGVSPLAAARAMKTTVRPAMRQLLTAAVRAVLEVRPDVVIYHPKVLTAPHAAEAVGAACVVVETVPTLTASRAFPMPGTLSRDLGPLNRVTYRAAAGAAALFRREINEAVQALGNRPQPRHPGPPAASLLPISPVLLERPADWPAASIMTGPWVASRGHPVLDPPVAEFLEKGPFLYAGFGSMVAGDPEERTRAIIEAARATGFRVLLATGWGGLALPGNGRGTDVLAVTSVPHSLVLPKASVAIHHGGAGTAHAAAGAGVPSVIIPFIADQPFWARQLQARGLAARPLRQRRLTAQRLADRIAAADGLRTGTRIAAEAMRSERGTAHALQVIESALG